MTSDNFKVKVIRSTKNLVHLDGEYGVLLYKY